MLVASASVAELDFRALTRRRYLREGVRMHFVLVIVGLYFEFRFVASRGPLAFKVWSSLASARVVARQHNMGTMSLWFL